MSGKTECIEACPPRPPWIAAGVRARYPVLPRGGNSILKLMVYGRSHAIVCFMSASLLADLDKEVMRILLYSGKGGVGKTSIAAATGVHLARLGYRTLVMSVDPAHSLSDAFDLESALFDGSTSRPRQIMDRLEIQEVNVNAEVKRHWGEVTAYITSILRTSGLSDVEAEEIAILPGMEELSAMLYVNQYRRERTYDIIVLDMAPTAESVRFVSLPTTLRWYMENVFGFERTALKALRPIVNRLAPVQLHPTATSRTSRISMGRLVASTRRSRIRRSRACDSSPIRRKWSCGRRSERSSISRFTA